MTDGPDWLKNLQGMSAEEFEDRMHELEMTSGGFFKAVGDEGPCVICLERGERHSHAAIRDCEWVRGMPATFAPRRHSRFAHHRCVITLCREIEAKTGTTITLERE